MTEHTPHASLCVRTRNGSHRLTCLLRNCSLFQPNLSNVQRSVLMWPVPPTHLGMHLLCGVGESHAHLSTVKVPCYIWVTRVPPFEQFHPCVRSVVMSASTEDRSHPCMYGGVQVTHGRTEDLQEGAGILASSKSVLKRQREEAAAEATDRKARHLRQEMRRRGHAKVPRRGEDPAQDAAEKLLLRTARRVCARPPSASYLILSALCEQRLCCPWLMERAVFHDAVWTQKMYKRRSSCTFGLCSAKKRCRNY